MAEEIERKEFLISDDTLAQGRGALRMISMEGVGYVASGRRCSMRVRSNGQRAWINLKSRESGMRRLEFEYEIPIGDAEVMLKKLCDGAFIDKTRYWVEDRGHTWEVDVFHGQNSGLVIAEVELNSITETVAPAGTGL